MTQELLRMALMFLAGTMFGLAVGWFIQEMAKGE